jgi:serine/threonine-protein kinase
LIIFLILFFVVDSFIMPAITRHGSEFALPDISGLNCDEAAKILESADLGMEIISKEFNSNKPEGTVISQYPPAGTKVKAGRIIKATISVGAKTAIVPPLRGFSVRQAKLNIEAAGLVMGEIAWTFSDSLPEKVVVFSYPASGTEVPGGTAVNLMVNRGRVAGAVYMPNLIGKPLDEAKKIIEEMGLKLGLVTYRRDENYLPETVIEQSAPEATELDSGEEIDLIVSTTD